MNETPKTIAVAKALSTVAAIATFSLITHSTAQQAAASQPMPAPSAKAKQCVMLYSPRYKKLRIKPIQVSYRWCSAANPTDCTNWKSDTVADVGKPFSIAAYCFTHKTPVNMELRYNRRFDDYASQQVVTIKPHAMKLKGNLAPHPFCGKKSAHRFVMKRGGAMIRNGKPRDVIEPKCVWNPIKTKAAS